MKEHKNSVNLFCLVTALYWFSLYTYVPTLTPYAESLGASYKLIGLIAGSYGFTQMLLRIPLGIVSDRLNRRKPFIMAGIAVSLLSALGFWYFPKAGSVLLFRGLSGVAATTWVTFTVLFSSYYKGDDAPKAIGVINTYNYIGQVVALLVGSAAAQRFGQQAPFIIAVLGALCAFSLSTMIKENRDIDHKPLQLRELLLVARDQRLMLVSVLAIFSQFVSFATVYGFTPVVAKGIGANSIQLGMLTTVATLPRVFASFMSGSFFAKRWGEKQTLVWGFAVSAMTCIATPFISSIWLLSLNQVIGGFGQGITFTLLMGLSIKHVEPAKRATAMGFFQAIYGVGMFFGPTVIGLIGDAVGLVWGYMVVMLVSLAGSVLSLRLAAQEQIPLPTGSDTKP